MSGADGLLLLGAPGIGKSALLRGLAERARERRGPVLQARAAPWETDEPGGVLRQLLQAEPPGGAIAAADRLAEVILGETPDAERPTLVLVDDADLADELSLHALASLLRRHRAAALLVVVAATAPTPELDALATDAIRLEGLSAAAMSELAGLRGRVLHAAMADELARHTAGNPRDALALLAEVPSAVWARPGSPLPAPAHVTADVRRALDRCTPGGRALVEAYAVLGERESLGSAARLADLADPLAAVDEAVSAGLLTVPSPTEGPRLAGPLVASAVVSLMGAQRSARAHRRAAEIVENPVDRVRHLAAATSVPDAELADRVDALARERGSAGAWAEASVLFRDASRLTLDPLLRDERLIRSVDALVAAGDCIGAAALVPAVESLRETPLRDAVLAYLAVVRGREVEADVRLRRAWDIVNAGRDPDTAALIAQRHVLHSLARCRGDELVEWADRAVELAGRESAAGVEAAAIRGLGLAISGRMGEAAAAYDEAARLVGHGAQAQRVSMGRGWLSALADEPDDARRRLEGVTTPGLLGGSSRISLWALGWLARVRFQTGDWNSALQAVEEGRLLAADTGIVLATPLLEWTAAQVHVLRGEWEAAGAAARAAESVVQGYQIMQVPALLARAQIAEAASDHTAVRRLLEPLTRVGPGTSVSEPSFWPWAEVYTTALVVEGRLEEAAAFLRPHEERAEAEGHRSARARLGCARGQLLGAAGHMNAAESVFEESLGLLDGLPLRYDRARVLFAYGQTLRRAGRRRAATAVLAGARELWDGLGARTYVDRCDRELKAGGARGSVGAGTTQSLTPQEETVAELVASGLSNREVAARLYVSPKTVQYHLTRIYAKLGVRSRTELAARQGGEPTRGDRDR